MSLYSFCVVTRSLLHQHFQYTLFLGASQAPRLSAPSKCRHNILWWAVPRKAGSRPCVLDTAEGGAVRGGRSLAACLALDGDRPRWYGNPAGKTEARPGPEPKKGPPRGPQARPGGGAAPEAPTRAREPKAARGRSEGSTGRRHAAATARASPQGRPRRPKARGGGGRGGARRGRSRGRPRGAAAAERGPPRRAARAGGGQPPGPPERGRPSRRPPGRRSEAAGGRGRGAATGGGRGR